MPAKFSAKAAQGEHIQILRYRYRYTSNQSYSQSCPKPTTQYSVILVPSSQMNLHTSSNSTSTDSNDYPYELRSSKISSSVNRKLGTTKKSSDFSFPIPNPARAIQSPQRLLKSSHAIRSRYQTPPMPPNLPPGQQNSKKIVSPDSLRTSGTAGGGDGEKPPRTDGRKNKKKIKSAARRGRGTSSGGERQAPPI